MTRTGVRRGAGLVSAAVFLTLLLPAPANAMTCVTSAYKPFVDAQGDIFGKAIASCSSSTYAIVITVEIYKGTNNLVGSRTESTATTQMSVSPRRTSNA